MKISFVLSSTTTNLNFIPWVIEKIPKHQVTLIFVLSDYPIISNIHCLIYTPEIFRIRESENIRQIKKTVEKINKIVKEKITTIIIDERDPDKLQRALKTTKPDLVVLNTNFRLKNWERIDDFIENTNTKILKIPQNKVK